MNKGWKRKRLGEVCTIDKRQGIHRGLPYIGLEHIEPNTARFIGSSAPQAVKSTTFRFTQEHVLYGRLRPYLNKAYLPDFEGHCSTEIYPLKPSRELLREYLLRWLLTDATCLQINKTCRGARMPRAKMGELMRFELPVPPPEEQRRIVNLLDKACNGLAKAKENAEKNLQNARALFESGLQNAVKNNLGIKATKRLGQVCVVERGSSPRPIKQFFTTRTNGVNWVKIGDTEEGGKYIYETAQKITPEGAKQSRFVDVGDLVLTNSMSFGRPYIMKTSGYIHDGWFVLRPDKCIEVEFFYYLLSSKHVQEQFHKLAAGSVVKNISGDLVKKALLPVPSLAEQKQISSSMSKLAEETQRLARLYEQKLEALESLKKSILHEAFSGNL